MSTRIDYLAARFFTNNQKDRMRIAVIDMGTNTFHLLLAEVSDKGYEVLHRDRVPVKIGEGGISRGIIAEAAMERAVSTLKAFRRTIDEAGADRIFATATSAVRSAANGEELKKRVKTETGIEIRIIGGDEEAEAIYEGVRNALDLGEQPSLILDVGGGSIEFVIGNRDEIYWEQSFEMGGQRLLDKFHQSDPISDDDLNLLTGYLESNLQPLLTACDRYQPQVLVGSSGTFDTLSDIFRNEENISLESDATELPLTVEGFERIYKKLISLPREDRLNIPGMIEMRVDMIVVACVLVKFVVDRIGIGQIRVSSFALKEGILMRILDSIKTEKLH